MKRMLTLVCGLLAMMLADVASGQAPNADLALKISKARQDNAGLMKKYSWSSRTELMEKGTVADVRLESVAYGPDGQLQRTLVNDQSAPLPRGFIRKKVAEDKREKVEKYLKGLVASLDQYSLPTAGKMLDFIDKGQITAVAGGLQISGAGVVQDGDSVTLIVDTAKFQSITLQVKSTFDGSAISLSATFKTNKAGLNYVAFAEVEVPDKEMSLQVHNYDFVQND